MGTEIERKYYDCIEITSIFSLGMNPHKEEPLFIEPFLFHGQKQLGACTTIRPCYLCYYELGLTSTFFPGPEPY